MDEEIELFDIWNTYKKHLNKSKKNFYPKNREVWYISIGKNIGFESNGKGEDFKRPVLILKRIGTMFLIVSMTTKGKDNDFYFALNNKYFEKDSFITLSQIKTVDKKRFIEKIGKIDVDDFLEIKNRIKKFF
ncbi:MAG: type II toxin-antitoxin system PemK/MazF family toxin [Candidatus Gracilibacteria bacterium]|nr:type II toxin-antitoxin system PemK/MazF family toxin [Candidatus Gracilibacteria bacterium]